MLPSQNVESLDNDNLCLQVTKYLANNPTIMINYNLSLLSNIPSLIFSMYNVAASLLLQQL